MVAQKNSSTTQLQVDVGVIKEQVGELKKGQDRLELAVGSINAVSPKEFAEFKVYVDKELAKKEDSSTIKPYKAILVTIGGAILTAGAYAFSQGLFK